MTIYDSLKQPFDPELVHFRVGARNRDKTKGLALAYIDARQLYLDFVTLYGDHERAPYAQFQAGVCALAQANQPSKDQSQTYAAFADLRADRYDRPGSLEPRSPRRTMGAISTSRAMLPATAADTERSSAATPATCGDAIEVPCSCV